METQPVPDKAESPSLHKNFIAPFENIALAFSGGGFRAASYALGVMSYLSKAHFDGDDDALKGNTLLQQVTYLSSASGGTITTALYALYSAQGKTFGEFYTKLFNTLTGDQLLKDALEILSNKKRWANRPLKNRNIINAFAMAYDEYIFEGHTLQSLNYKGSLNGHLQEVCFNTTEFYTGQSFRQDKKMAPDAQTDEYFKFGNEAIFLNCEVAGQLKLADLLAASSCFPAGFEPIIFPDDFTYSQSLGNNGLSEAALQNGLTLVPQTGDKQETAFIANKRIGLMDGGITDNQGLQSMMYADGRRLNLQTDFKPFDFMMVNDVGSHYIKPYVMPDKVDDKGSSLRSLYIIITALLVAAIGITAWGAIINCLAITIAGSMLITIPLIFTIGNMLIKRKLSGIPGSSSSLNLKKNYTEAIIKLLISYFTKTPLIVLKQMLSARTESVLMLNMSIFLKRIRQLLYNTFYGSPQWKNRGKGNHIYDLSFSNDINRKNAKPPLPPQFDPSHDMQVVAQTAFNMGTTLWFDKEASHQQHSEACIIACGQFTTCYNLLEYVGRLKASHSAVPTYEPKYSARIDNLEKQLLSDYEHFKTDPFFMYNQYGVDNHIRDFKPLKVSDIPPLDNWH